MMGLGPGGQLLSGSRAESLLHIDSLIKDGQFLTISYFIHLRKNLKFGKDHFGVGFRKTLKV